MMKHLHFYIGLLVLFSINIESHAQQDRVGIGVYVYDADTHQTMRDCIVTVMDLDSTILFRPQSYEVVKNSKEYRFDAFPPRRTNYIIKVEKEKYETSFQIVTLQKNEKQIMADDILLHRKPIELDEVTVIGSKVLMVNRGDTIVYNASALQLSNGVMLDALIKQLPGVELHQGGRITVNGKYVSSLLVNGRNFFKGDPKIIAVR